MTQSIKDLPKKQASKGRILFASLIGTTIEYFDFYSYGTAAVLVFPHLFFPAGNTTTGTLQAFGTFALAFLARPIGAALFGHYGDRIGRKATLIAALLTMGISTVLIGLLPTYAQIGLLAPLLLSICRIGQGLGLGGEWGGAVLLATENAPKGKESWYGMFPQLGAPLGFLLSTGMFLFLTVYLTEQEFLSWGWRVPFIASVVLVAVGLWVRLNITETPEFQKVLEKQDKSKIPFGEVIFWHYKPLIIGTLASSGMFTLFYLMTVFTLSWGISSLGYSRNHFLILQMIGVLFFALFIPLSAIFAEKTSARKSSIIACFLIAVFGFLLEPLFLSGSDLGVLFFLSLGLGIMGFMYGPIAAALSNQFPARVRYTGSSLAFNFAGILGSAFTPYIATNLGNSSGLQSVGWFLSAMATVSLIASFGLKNK